MDDPNAVRVPMRCDCGHEFAVPIAGKNLDTLEYRCPACGLVDRFTPEQVVEIVQEHEAIAKRLRDSIAGIRR